MDQQAAEAIARMILETVRSFPPRQVVWRFGSLAAGREGESGTGRRIADREIASAIEAYLDASA